MNATVLKLFQEEKNSKCPLDVPSISRQTEEVTKSNKLRIAAALARAIEPDILNGKNL